MRGVRSVFTTEIQVIVPPTMSEKEYHRLTEDLFEPLEDIGHDVHLLFKQRVKKLDSRLIVTMNSFPQ